MCASREERERELLELMLNDPDALRRQYEKSFGQPPDSEVSNLELVKQILASEHAGESPFE
jgi:hypothetical protein